MARNPMDQSSVSLNNRHTTGAENYTGKVFQRFEPQYAIPRGYYGSAILIGLFAQTMHISNTAIWSEINCPNTRPLCKIRSFAYGSRNPVDFRKLVLGLAGFCGFLAHHADFQLWNNASETDMAAKLTNSNHGETAVTLYSALKKMEASG